MPDYQNNPEGYDGPFIRIILYIIFTLGGAVVGGFATFFYLDRYRGHQYHHGFRYYIIQFILGAIGGAITAFTTVYQVCRDADSEK